MSNSNQVLNGEHITISRLGTFTVVLSTSSLKDKTISQLKKQLIDNNQMNTNEHLSISTPFYRMIFDDNDKPVNMFPQLAKAQRPKKFELPDYYIAIVKKDEEGKIVFNLDSKVQEGQEVPFWEFYIDKKELENSSNNVEKLLEMMSEKFPYDHDKTNVGLELNGQNVPSTSKAKDILNDMKERKYTFRTVLTENAIKKISFRSQIVREVISTEKTYIDGLIELNGWWQEKLIEEKVLSEDEAHNIFRDFPNIISCHQNFYSEIQAKGDSICASLSGVFLNFSAFFKVSNLYISNYASYTEIISQKSKNATLAEKLKKLQFSTPSNSNRDVTSYLITPVQRMPRYILFIRELIKHTPDGHPDKRMLEYAAETVQQVTHQIDEATQKSENMAKLISIHNNLTNKYDLITPSRMYTREAKVTVLKPVNCAGIFYMFNDILFLTTIERKGETYIFAKKIGEFRYWDGMPTANSITFTSKPVSKSLFSSKIQEITVLFNDPNEKSTFLSNIEQYQIQQYNNDQIDKAFLFQNHTLKSPFPTTYLNDFVTVNQTAYSYGGKCNGVASSTTSIYRISQGISTNITCSEVGERYGHTLTVVDNKIYLFGGTNGSEYFNDLWSFDTAATASRWEKEVCEDPPEPRSGHSTVYYDGKLFVYGGRNKRKQILNDIVVYNFANERWSSLMLPQAPKGRYYHSATVIESIMLIFGGKDKSPLNDIALFDMNKLIWMPKPTLKFVEQKDGETELEGRYGHRAIFVGGWMIIIGGKINKTVKTDDFVLKKQNAIGLDLYEFWKSNYTKPIEVYNLFTGGNDPSSLFHFGFAYETGSHFLIYGGRDIETKIPTCSMFSVILPKVITTQIHEEFFEKAKNKPKVEDAPKALSSMVKETKPIENKETKPIENKETKPLENKETKPIENKVTKPSENKVTQETPLHNTKPIVNMRNIHGSKTIGPNSFKQRTLQDPFKSTQPIQVMPNMKEKISNNSNKPQNNIPSEYNGIFEELNINVKEVSEFPQFRFMTFIRKIKTYDELKKQNALLTQKVEDQKAKLASNKDAKAEEIFIKLKDKRTNKCYLIKTSNLTLSYLQEASRKALSRNPLRLMINTSTITNDNCRQLILSCKSLTPTVTIL